MASGSFSLGTSGRMEGQCIWSSSSNGSVANSSNVNVIIQVRRTNSYTTTGTWSAYADINGQYGNTEEIHASVNDSWVTLRTISGTIAHNNDGTKTIYVGGAIDGPSGTSLAGEHVEAYQNVNLDTIPRYTSITEFGVSKDTSMTENQLKFNFTADDTISKVEYSTNNGSTWTTYSNDINAKSKTFIVSGLTAGTTYNCKVRVTRRDNGLQTTSTAISHATYSYPYIISVTKTTLTIGDSQSLSIYNPLKRTITIKMNKTNTSGTELYNSTTNVSSFAFIPNEDVLYNSIPNSKNADCVYSVTYNGNTSVKSGCKYQVNENTNKPTFRTFEYKDTATSALIQAINNNQVLVQNASNVNLVISSVNKMVAKNSATGGQYNVTFGNLTKQVPYSNNDIDSNLGIITSSGSVRFNVVAQDSRQLLTPAYLDLSIIPYSAPTLQISLARKNNFENETYINASGNYSQVLVSNVAKNSIQSVQYRYKESTAQSYGSWTSLTLSSNTGGSYRVNQATISLDNTKAYDFEIKVTDKQTSTITTGRINVGEPTMFLSVDGTLEVTKFKGNVETGSLLATSANLAPIIVRRTGNPYASAIRFENSNGMLGGIGFTGDANGRLQRWNKDFNTSYEVIDRSVVKAAVSAKSHTDYNNNQTFIPTMNFLTYWNGAYNSSGNSNLTYAHQGTIQCKPTNLYNSATGTTGTITLSQTCANFTYLEIQAKHSSGNAGYYTTRVYSPNNKIVDISDNTTDVDNWIVLHSALVKFSGTSMTRVRSAGLAMNITNQDLWNGGYSTAHEIVIYRIDGYK